MTVGSAGQKKDKDRQLDSFDHGQTKPSVTASAVTDDGPAMAASSSALLRTDSFSFLS